MNAIVHSQHADHCVKSTVASSIINGYIYLLNIYMHAIYINVNSCSASYLILFCPVIVPHTLHEPACVPAELSSLTH